MEKIKIERWHRTVSIMETKMLDSCPENMHFLMEKINELIRQINNLSKPDVIKSVCDHSHWNIIWTKGSAYKQCLLCSKKWKQTVL